MDIVEARLGGVVDPRPLGCWAGGERVGMWQLAGWWSTALSGRPGRNYRLSDVIIWLPHP